MGDEHCPWNLGHRVLCRASIVHGPFWKRFKAVCSLSCCEASGPDPLGPGDTIESRDEAGGAGSQGSLC